MIPTVRRLQVGIVKVTSHCHRVLDEGAFAPRGHPLEPRLGGNRLKGASPVLRGGGGGNAVSLPDLFRKYTSQEGKKGLTKFQGLSIVDSWVWQLQESHDKG